MHHFRVSAFATAVYGQSITPFFSYETMKLRETYGKANQATPSGNARIRPVVHTGMSHWRSPLQPKHTSVPSAAEPCACKRRRLRINRCVRNAETLLHERRSACLSFKHRRGCFQCPLRCMHTLQLKTSLLLNNLFSITTAETAADMVVVVGRMVVRRTTGIATTA